MMLRTAKFAVFSSVAGVAFCRDCTTQNNMLLSLDCCIHCLCELLIEMCIVFKESVIDGNKDDFLYGLHIQYGMLG